MIRGGRAAQPQFQLGDHICMFVDGADDVVDVMAQVVAAGLDAGDKIMMFTEVLPPAAVLAGMKARGVPVSAARGPGQLEVMSAREAYLAAGRFEPARMLGALVSQIDQAIRAGYPGLRLVGDMSWALAEPVCVDQLVEYEARVNLPYLDGFALGVCLYNRSAFPLDLLQQVACAHPATTTARAESGWAPQLSLRRSADPYGLRLAGEADISNRQALGAALNAVLDQQPDPSTPIVVDLAGLRFADAGSATLLGRLTMRAPAGVHLAGCHGAVEAILARLGITQLPKMHLIRAPGGMDSGETELVA